VRFLESATLALEVLGRGAWSVAVRGAAPWVTSPWNPYPRPS